MFSPLSFLTPEMILFPHGWQFSLASTLMDRSDFLHNDCQLSKTWCAENVQTDAQNGLTCVNCNPIEPSGGEHSTCYSYRHAASSRTNEPLSVLFFNYNNSTTAGLISINSREFMSLGHRNGPLSDNGNFLTINSFTATSVGHSAVMLRSNGRAQLRNRSPACSDPDL